MSDDINLIIVEIERRALHTTEHLPMQLYLEFIKLQKRLRMWKFGGGAVGVLVGIVVFFALFSNDAYGFPEAGAVALAVFFLIAIVGRADINTKTENWLARARLVVN